VQEHLQRAVAEEAVSLIVLDLDHFKMLNDTFGHAEGDRVLQATATTLSRTVGAAGFVARVGGEEFAIALSGAGEEAAVAVAERCRGALASLASAGTPLACSAGVASYSAHAGGVAPVFQPVMEVAAGRVAWYEALARFAPPYARPPLTWFEQAHRCGLGPALEACAIRAARAAPGSRSTTPAPVTPASSSSSACGRRS
jgi:diguanylate cyclase (GGDEF)-like protein